MLLTAQPPLSLLCYFFNELIIKVYLILISNIANISIYVAYIYKRSLAVLTDFKNVKDL